MAKRFVDTGLFDDDWFMDLSQQAKLLWVYFITKCDHAGIIHINVKLCKVQTDINDLQTVIKELGNRLITLNEQLYFIPKFIEYQYPGFPNSKVRQQASVVAILQKYNLLDKITLTVSKELTNSYGNGNGIVTVPGTENGSGNYLNFEETFEILNSENEIGWRETIMMVSSVKTDRQLKVFIKEFLLIQKANNYFPHEISDTKRYFLNWVRSKSAVSTDSSVSDVLESKMKVY